MASKTVIHFVPQAKPVPENRTIPPWTGFATASDSPGRCGHEHEGPSKNPHSEGDVQAASAELPAGLLGKLASQFRTGEVGRKCEMCTM